MNERKLLRWHWAAFDTGGSDVVAWACNYCSDFGTLTAANGLAVESPLMIRLGICCTVFGHVTHF